MSATLTRAPTCTPATGGRPRPPVVGTAAAILAVGVAAWLSRSLRRVEVAGRSMEPTLLAGDRLLVLGVRPTAGRLIVVRDPRLHPRLLVKRCLEVGADGGVAVRGDDPGHSTDSRHFGPVPADLVVGRPLYRYEPPATSGWVWSG